MIDFKSYCRKSIIIFVKIFDWWKLVIFEIKKSSEIFKNSAKSVRQNDKRDLSERNLSVHWV